MFRRSKCAFAVIKSQWIVPITSFYRLSWFCFIRMAKHNLIGRKLIYIDYHNYSNICGNEWISQCNLQNNALNSAMSLRKQNLSKCFNLSVSGFIHMFHTRFLTYFYCFQWFATLTFNANLIIVTEKLLMMTMNYLP